MKSDSMAMTAAWHGTAGIVVVIAVVALWQGGFFRWLLGAAEEMLLQDDENGPPLLRVRLTGAMARVFAKRALEVVAAGRPPCPLCTLPLDPEGHVCPRQNGYRRGVA